MTVLHLSLGLSHHLLGLATFFLTLVFVSVLLRERRSPGSAMAWLFAIVLAPYIGIPLYLYVARRKLRGRKSEKNELYAPVRYVETPRDAGTVERLLLSAGAPDKRLGNSVALVTDGVEAFKGLLSMIDSAKREIHIATFILGRDEVAADLIERLDAKARGGVKVRFLLDGLGVLLTSRSSLKRLKSAGVEVVSFLPLLHLPFRGNTNLRNHRKIVVVDGEQAVVGGMNLAHEYMGPRTAADRWTDLALRVRGPAVADIQAIFRSDWKFASGQVIEDGPKAGSATAGDSTVQVVASGPDVPCDLIYDSMLTAIFEARRRIWITTPYFIPDETLTRALQLACRRGVEVRVYVPGHSNHVLADIGRGSYLRQIEELGARILLFPKMVHAKATLIDDSYAIVGSANTDMRSFFLNYEVCAFQSSKPDVDALAAWFERVGADCARGYPRPKFGTETLEGISRILSPLL